MPNIGFDSIEAARRAVEGIKLAERLARTPARSDSPRAVGTGVSLVRVTGAAFGTPAVYPVVAETWSEVEADYVQVGGTAYLKAPPGAALADGDYVVAVASGRTDSGSVPVWACGTAGGVVAVVRADGDGAAVTAFVQRDDGAGGLEDDPDLASIEVKVFPDPAREDFEEDGYYLAARVGGQWYAETGPKTACQEVVTEVECVDGELTVTTETIRVIDRSCA